MLRLLQGNTAKNIQIVTAGEAMTRGACVTLDVSDRTIDKATLDAGFYLVDSIPNYEGINAVVPPTDGSFETIVSGDECLLVPVYVGERYATTELTVTGLSVGDYLIASAGKFVKASSADVVEWNYQGTYSDPTGKTMYAVECVPSHTVA